jgi:hypothetical protein
MYKKLKDITGTKEAKVIQRISDNSFIPKDPDNTDYQTYLKWLAEGNTPEEAD